MNCKWCKEPQILAKDLCDMCEGGWDAAQKWAAQQPDPRLEAKNRKTRLETASKMNNMVQFTPVITCRLARNSKGRYE